jgi:hypothetical protein
MVNVSLNGRKTTRQMINKQMCLPVRTQSEGILAHESTMHRTWKSISVKSKQNGHINATNGTACGPLGQHEVVLHCFACLDQTTEDKAVHRSFERRIEPVPLTSGSSASMIPCEFPSVLKQNKKHSMKTPYKQTDVL